MNVLKRVTSVLLSLLMVIGLFSAVPTAYAAGILDGTLDGGITYELDDEGTLTITGSGEMPDFDLATYAPWYSNRYNVKKIVISEGITSIGKYNFTNLYYVTDLTMPGTIKTIGYGAFMNCIGLPEIVIPDSVVSIADRAFMNNTELHHKATKIVLGANLVSIGTSAFYELRYVTEIKFNEKLKTLGSGAFTHMQFLSGVVTLPDSLETIGSYAFDSLMNVEEFRLGNNVKSIGDNAFTSCSSLTKINIPKSVSYIGVNPFKRCPLAIDCDFDDENAYYSCDGKALFDKEQTRLISCFYDGTYTIPDTVTEICPQAFYGASVKNVRIANSVQIIGEQAFYGCSNLKDVVMGSSVVTVGDEAFRGCASIEQIAFPASTTTIGSRVFYGCLALNSFLILNNNATFGTEVFAATNGVTVRANTGSTAEAYVASVQNPDTEPITFEVADVHYPNPTTLKYATGTDYNAITVSWYAAEDNNCDGYIVARSTDNSNYKIIGTTATSITSFVDNTVDVNRTYYYKVAVVVYNNNLPFTSAYSDSMGASAHLGDASITDYYIENYNTAMIYWESVRGAEGYDVETRLAGQSTWNHYNTFFDVTSARVTGLNTDMDTEIRVRAIRYDSDNNPQAGDAKNTVTVHPVLSDIYVEDAKAINYNTIRVLWRPVEGAESYRIDYSTNSDMSSATTLTVSGSETSYSITNLDSFTKYYVRVRAIRSNAAGTTFVYSPVCGPFTPILKDVENLTAERIGLVTVALSWDVVEGAEGYYVDYSTDNGETWQRARELVNGSDTAYTVDKLLTDTSYKFKVTAFRHNMPTNLLGTDVNLQIDNQGTSAVLNWTVVNDADGYYIECKRSDDIEWTRIYTASNGTDNTYTVTGLVEGQDYNFKVTAFVDNPFKVLVTSLNPTIAEQTIVTTFNPPVITSVTMTSYNKTSVIWEKSVGATWYTVYRSIDGGAYEEIGTRSEEDEINQTETYYLNDTVDSGKKFEYKVVAHYRAYDEDTKTYIERSSQASAVKGVSIIENAPVLAVNSVDYESVTVNWNAVNEAYSYYIQWSTDANADANGTWQTYKDAVTDTTFTLHNLNVNTKYYFRVYARNESGTRYSRCSAVIVGIPTLGVPQNVKGSCIRYNTVRIEWDYVIGASGYTIQRKTADSDWADIKTIADTDVKYYDDSDVVTGITYDYRVAAYRNINNSPQYGNYSSVVTVKPVLDPMTLVNATTKTINYKTNRIVWNNIDGVVSYKIYRSVDGGDFECIYVAPSTANTYDDNQAITNSSNTYYVLAYRSDIATSKSNEVTLYPVLTTPQVTGHSVNSSTSLTLEWDAVNGATDYTVYISDAEGGSTGSTSYKAISNSYQFTNLIANKQYYFYVVANYTMEYYDRRTVQSSPSNIYSAGITLVAPENRTAVAESSTQIKLTWDEVNEVVGYRIYKYDGNNWNLLVDLNNSSYLIFRDTDLEEGTAYKYKICSYLLDDGNVVESSMGEFGSVTTMPGKCVLTNVNADNFETVALTYTASVSEQPVVYIIQRKLITEEEYTNVGTSDTITFSDDTAETGMRYLYRIVPTITYNEYYIEGEPSNAVEAKTLLESPVISSITQADYNAATLVWNSTLGADGYVVMRSLDGASTTWSEIERIKGNDNTTYTDKTLTCNVKYYYCVLPMRFTNDGDYIGEDKNVVEITTHLATPSITSLVCTGYKSVVIKWNKINGADGYRIYRAINGASFAMIDDVKGVDNTTYTETDLVCGSTYKYKVCAYNIVGNKQFPGDESTVKSVQVLPSTPSFSTVKVSKRTNVVLKWSAIDGAEKYRIYRSSTSATSGWTTVKTLSAENLTYTDTGLTEGKTYYYTITAIRGNVISKHNDGKAAVLIPATPKISKVAGITYNTLKVTWGKVSDCDGYVIYRSLKADSGWSKVTTITNPDTVTYTDRITECGATYYYTIKAYWKTTSGNVYSKYNKGVGGNTVPTATKITSVKSNGYNSVKIAWSAISEASGYRIYRSETATGGWTKVADVTDGTTVSYKNSNLTTGKTYYYTVRTFVSVNGEKIFGSYEKTGVAGTPIPTTPKISSASVKGAKQIALTWNKINGASGYRIYRSTSKSTGFATLAVIKDGATVTYTDETAVPGTQYYYTVKAYTTVDGKNVYSKYVSPGTAGKTTITAPKISSATATGYNQISLKWNKKAGVDGYLIYRKVKSGSWSKIKNITNGNTTAYVDKTAKYNTEYYYTIRAYVTINGKNYTSTYYTAGTLGKATAVTPTFTLASVGYNSIKLSWTQVGQADGYIIYRSLNSDDTGWKAIKTIKSGTTVTYTDTTAECGTTYYYTMRSYKTIDGKQVKSSYLKNGKSCVAKPATPVVTAQQQQDKTVFLQWNKIDGAATYKIYRKVAGGSWSVIATEEGNNVVYMDETAEPDVQYIYTVRAVSSNNITSAFKGVTMTMYVEEATV
ncbi:MAG: leucine-rich repeat protein [Acutalibacteraceae bacterium]